MEELLAAEVIANSVDQRSADWLVRQ